MRDRRAIRRTARVLYDVAEARGRADAVRSDLLALGTAMESVPDVAGALTDPSVDGADRGRMIETLSGLCTDPLTREFVRRVDAWKLAPSLPLLARDFERLHEDRHGVVRARLTAAALPSADWAGRMATALGARLGRTVLTEVAADPALLAGFRVRVGDQVFDLSAAARLEQLRRVWTGAR